MKSIHLFLAALFVAFILIIYQQDKYESFTGSSPITFIDEPSQYSDKLSKDDIKNLKKGQEKMTKMLQEFHDICQKNKITYFIWGGNLLGSQLYKGWIPWDGDVDLYVLSNDYNKLENILINKPPYNTWYQTLKTDKYYRRPSGNNNPLPKGKLRDLTSCYVNSQDAIQWHNGLQIDINTFDIIKNKVVFGTQNSAEIRIQKEITVNDILPVKQAKYDNIIVNIPNNTIKILDLHYTDSWRKLPPINSRYPHEGVVDPNHICPHHYKLYPQLYKDKDK